MPLHLNDLWELKIWITEKYISTLAVSIKKYIQMLLINLLSISLEKEKQRKRRRKKIPNRFKSFYIFNRSEWGKKKIVDEIRKIKQQNLDILYIIYVQTMKKGDHLSVELNVKLWNITANKFNKRYSMKSILFNVTMKAWVTKHPLSNFLKNLYLFKLLF